MSDYKIYGDHDKNVPTQNRDICVTREYFGLKFPHLFSTYIFRSPFIFTPFSKYFAKWCRQ